MLNEMILSKFRGRISIIIMINGDRDHRPEMKSLLFLYKRSTMLLKTSFVFILPIGSLFFATTPKSYSLLSRNDDMFFLLWES